MSEKNFDVLYPIYKVVGKQTSTWVGRDGIPRISTQDVWSVTWHLLGQAVDMADAKKKFGGAPILEKPL